MNKPTLLLLAALLFAAGYVAGTSAVTPARQLQAAQQAPTRFDDDMLQAYRRSHLAMSELGDILNAQRTYQPATEGQNFFALSIGGIDAVRDLEEGRGVDPETFAGLYANRALPEVAEHLETGADGRIRYKGNVVRLYSRQRLDEVFAQRNGLETRSNSIRN